MTHHVEATTVGRLVMVRLLTAGERGATLAQVRKDLQPLLEHRWAGAGVGETIEEALGRLLEAGMLRRVKKGKSENIFPTDEGRRSALEFLGIHELPPKTTWAALEKGYILALALGLPAPAREKLKTFTTDNGFKAALLKVRYGLPTADYPTMKQVTDALAWKILGVDSAQPFKTDSVLKELFNRPLGEHRQADSKKALQKVVLKAANARKDSPAELREAVLRDWVERETTPPREARETQAHAAAAPVDLEAFSGRVLSAARSSSTGRFGERRVFIAHVWQALRGDPQFAGWDFARFSRALVEANQARLLDLSRADLVEAMGSDDVNASEVRHLGASFHFVRV